MSHWDGGQTVFSFPDWNCYHSTGVLLPYVSETFAEGPPSKRYSFLERGLMDYLQTFAEHRQCSGWGRSPHRTVPSFFITGTRGEAQSLAKGAIIMSAVQSASCFFRVSTCTGVSGLVICFSAFVPGSSLMVKGST